jgi:hypothetical protein
MVYGRQTKAQDFSGMYCTMLAVDEVIVSVGIFRVFGSELAELPLVATSKDCQGQVNSFYLEPWMFFLYNRCLLL